MKSEGISYSSDEMESLILLLLGLMYTAFVPVLVMTFGNNHRKYQRLASSNPRIRSWNLCKAQSWVIAEAYHTPECLPGWMHDPKDILGATNFKVNGSLSYDSPFWKRHNDSPLWVAFIAQVVSSDGRMSHIHQVYPVTGYLAPKGGTTNLCNETERYQDFCEFRVNFSPSYPESPASFFLIIQNSENEHWILELLR